MRTPYSNIHIIINPFSGTHSKKGIQKKIRSVFKSYNVDATICFTQGPKHASELCRHAIEDNADLVIAVGGDGTINEVAGELIHSDIALGIISKGSGNGFARHIGMHHKLEKTLKLILQGNEIRIDSCRANDIPFVNLSGIGFDARIAYDTKKNKHRGLKQYLSSSLKNLLNFNSFDAEICTDDQCHVGRFKGIVVANASLYGFNFKIAPLASLTDGFLDVVLLEHASIPKYLIHLPKFITSKLHKSPHIKTIKTKKLEVSLMERNYLHVDGEGLKLKDDKVIYSIIPHSLKIIVHPSLKGKI